MNKKTPIITISCYRDLSALDLQAQSISLYLDVNTPIYIVINEEDPSAWLLHFNKHLRSYYSKHNLTLLHKNEFDVDWKQWVPSSVNPWAVGWETQQVLKLCISTLVKSLSYVILDSANFLIGPWSPDQYNLPDDKVPCRYAESGLPLDIWHDYVKSLDLPGKEIKVPNSNTVNSFPATPMFLRTDLITGLINTKGGVNNFSRWFKYASRIKSEFVLYAVWLDYHGGIERFHQRVEDWGNPYLRDSRTNFEDNFEEYISVIGVHKPLRWSSINHRSWGDMNDTQYNRLKTKLQEFGLYPHFDAYRAEYVDIVF